MVSAFMTTSVATVATVIAIAVVLTLFGVGLCLWLLLVLGFSLFLFRFLVVPALIASVLALLLFLRPVKTLYIVLVEQVVGFDFYRSAVLSQCVGFESLTVHRYYFESTTRADGHIIGKKMIVGGISYGVGKYVSLEEVVLVVLGVKHDFP